MPVADKVKRQNWIEAIEKHQKFVNKEYFNICKRHFQSSDLVNKNGKLDIAQNAVPSIFNDIEIENVTNADSMRNTNCSECTELKSLRLKISQSES